MKTNILSIVLFLTAFIGTSCNKDEQTYAKQLEAEKTLIDEFIKREGITVLSEFPQSFKTNEYVLTPSGLYFQLVEEGSGDTVKKGDIVAIRYKQKTLNENAVTEEYWTTQDIARPSEVEYQISGESDCEAWHEAIKYMKKSDARCKIIVPSKLGFATAKNNLTPYFFEMKIKFHH